MISFMGAPPAWMGSNYSVYIAKEAEFVESIVALVCAKHRRHSIHFVVADERDGAGRQRRSEYERRQTVCPRDKKPR